MKQENLNPQDIAFELFNKKGQNTAWNGKPPVGVKITHIPTGIVVECEDYNSQRQNRSGSIHALIGKLSDLSESDSLKSAKGRVFTRYACPYCQATVDVEGSDKGNIIKCDFCSKSFRCW
jgi:protein subunit release factor A